MQYSFQYSKKKVLQGLRIHFVSRPEVKILAYVVNIFAIVAAVFYGLKKIRPEAFLLCAFLWIVLMIVFWFVMPNIIYKRAIRTFQDDFIATFDEEGVSLETERGSMEWDWHQFSNYFESSEFFHLYLNSRSFFLFPKEQMNLDFRNSLRKILQEKLRKGKY